MKKITVLTMAILLLLMLAACGGASGDSSVSATSVAPIPSSTSEDESSNTSVASETVLAPSITSVLDTETNTLLSLGDPQSVFDAVLGAGAESSGSVQKIQYLDGSVAVLFNENGEAININVAFGVPRLELYDYSYGDDAETVESNGFEYSDLFGISVYTKYYDAEGNAASVDDAEYEIQITFGKDGFISYNLKPFEVEQVG